MHDIPALSLDDSPALRWALNEACRTMDTKKIDKRLLALLQGPPTYYAGMCTRQKGNMKRTEVLRLSAEIMEVTAAPGFLRFLADLDGIRLPQDLNVSMMGRTRLSDGACGFFERRKGSCFLKYEDQKRVLKTYQVIYNRVKPSSGKLPSGHQWGDLLDAMVTKIWVEEQTKKGEAKRKRDAKRDSAVEEELFGPSRNPITGEIAVGGTPGPAQEGAKAVDGTPGPAQEGGNTGGDTPAPAEEGDNAVGGTPGAAEEGVTAREHAKQVEDEMEQYFLKENPKPPGWLPPYFLSWVVFGPLSSSPDEDFTMDMSSGPEVGSAKDGAEKKLKGKAGSSSLRSPAQLKMLAPPGTGMSRALSKKLESEENERTWRDDRSTRRSEALDRGQKQIAEVADTLKVLVKECRRDAEADEIERQSKRYAELEELHREDGDHDLADAVRKKRIKLLSGSLDKGAAIAVGAASSQTSGACSTDSRSTARHNAGRSPREDGSGTSACEGRSPSPELLVPPATHEDLTLTSISSGDSGGSVWDRNESPTSTVGATHPRSVGPSSWQESRRYASAQYEHASVPPPTVRSRQPGFGREGIATTTAVQSVHGGLGRSLDGAGEVPTRSYAFLFGGQAGDANQRLAFARGSSGYEVDSGRGQRSERAASGQAPDAGGRAL